MKNVINKLSLDLLNYLDGFCNNKDLIKVLSSEIELLANIDNANRDLKMTQLLILLYSANLYNYQFGFNISLSNILNNNINTLYPDINFEHFETLFTDELKQTLLLCARYDRLFSANVNLNITNKPWMCSTAYNFNQYKNTSNNSTELNLTPIIQRDATDCYIHAKSKDGGFVLARLDDYSEEFLKYAITSTANILNIGSGYGILERLSLILGAKVNVYCNDVYPEHLEIIKKLTPPNYQNSLKLISGFFPNELNFADNYFSVIGIFRVLHFMAPELLTASIIKANRLLEKGGHLILSSETPYIANWVNFIPVYEQNIKENKLWPGYIENTKGYESQGYQKKLPSSMHFLDVKPITRLLNENGFEIIKCATSNRAGIFPDEVNLDGKESVGAIARKIKNV